MRKSHFPCKCPKGERSGPEGLHCQQARKKKSSMPHIALFAPLHPITTHIISAATTLSPSTPLPPPPQFISPHFLFSSARKSPSSEKSSRECHAFPSGGVHSRFFVSTFRSALWLCTMQTTDTLPNVKAVNRIHQRSRHIACALPASAPLCGSTPPTGQ